jgi:predicted HTH transcriptional regulator
LFGKQPQRYFISSEIKCAHFHRITVTKPIPSYQVYKGDVFQLVDQAVDFVLSTIDLRVGTRDKSIQAPIEYELPRAAITEAIVNAVVHRDYTSNGSIQIMLFKDRLEVWNPGHLPYGLTISKLRGPHTSIPANPLLAEPMYLAGYIERMGTGTGDIIRLCINQKLKEPEFRQEEEFITTIWRKIGNKERKEKNTGGAIGGAMGGAIGGAIGGAMGGAIEENILTKRQMEILEILKKQPDISYRSLAKHLKINESAILKHLSILKEKGVIKRIGGTRGYWEVSDV